MRERVKSILRRLEKVAKQREQGRRARHRAEVPTVSLVGYTNAGKSTLFNRITEADVYAADQLFATLDPTLRRIDVPDVGATVLADTVGFIRHLPHDLVAAFKATLQETQEADLLLHVVDASDERFRENIDAVNTVLEEIEAADVPFLLVMNKVDALEDQSPRIERDDEGVPRAVWLSARDGLGIDLLFQALSERLGDNMVSFRLRIPPACIGRMHSAFYRMHCIQHEEFQEDGHLLLDVRMPESEWHRLEKRKTVR